MEVGLAESTPLQCRRIMVGRLHFAKSARMKDSHINEDLDGESV